MENILPEININFKTDENSYITFLFKKNRLSYECDRGIVIKLSLNTDGQYTAERIDNGKNFSEFTNEILEQIEEKYNKEVLIYKENENDGVDYSPDENIEITIPYNPEAIQITSGRFSLKEVYEMITGEDDIEPILDLSPDFQRNYVWDRTRKSRLIESILLKIPLPVFYLARDNEGKYQVVDGVQRLSVINEYFSNGFKLSNLEYLGKECDWKFYNKKNSNSLHPKFVRALRTYQIDCNIIEPSTPTEVKFEIFKRLNTGGKSLNNQEIRNSIMKKIIRDFIRTLAESEQFKKATCGKIKSKRMLDQEMVLRFVGFYFLYEVHYIDIDYKGNINNFLNKLVELLNDNSNAVPFEKVERMFYKSMEFAHILFGENAFKKIYPEPTTNNRLINKALFTAFSVLLTRYNIDEVTKIGNISNEFAIYLDKTKYLDEAITYGTSDKLRIDTTFLLIEKFLNKVIRGIEID